MTVDGAEQGLGDAQPFVRSSHAPTAVLIRSTERIADKSHLMAAQMVHLDTGKDRLERRVRQDALVKVRDNRLNILTSAQSLVQRNNAW
jgi:hypothetical protein